MNIGDKVSSALYGKGSIVTIEDGMAAVDFEKEGVISTALANLEKLYESHCFICERGISSEVNPRCDKCGWFYCSCGACGCEYRGTKRQKKV